MNLWKDIVCIILIGVSVGYFGGHIAWWILR